jgi:hypothetical protein
MLMQPSATAETSSVPSFLRSIIVTIPEYRMSRQGEDMSLGPVTAATDERPRDGACDEPEGGAQDGAPRIMHGKPADFYSGVPYSLVPTPARSAHMD